MVKKEACGDSGYASPENEKRETALAATARLRLIRKSWSRGCHRYFFICRIQKNFGAFSRRNRLRFVFVRKFNGAAAGANFNHSRVHDGNLCDGRFVAYGANVRLGKFHIHGTGLGGRKNERATGDLRKRAVRSRIQFDAAFTGQVKLRGAGTNAKKAVGSG